jgi:hypothetical protein
LASTHDLNRLVVAKDDNLIAITDRMISSPSDFRFEPFASNDIVYVAQAAANHTPLSRGFCVEYVLHPNACRPGLVKIFHSLSLANFG